MSFTETNSQELKKIVQSNDSSHTDSFLNNENVYFKLSQVLQDTSFNNINIKNFNDIPDLITPPETHRDKNDDKKSEQVVQDKIESKENDNKIESEEIIAEEYKSCHKLLFDSDKFIYKTTNTLLILLLCNELLHLLIDFNRTSISLFIFNSLMFLFYNSNKDIILETQNDILKNSSKYFMKITEFVKNKFNDFLTYFMDYFFSKNTQMIFKFVFNMAKNKVLSTYKLYKNKVFNPPLLIQTSNDNVYYVSFYLDGETYKIPIVVPRFSLNKKQSPLMILNKNEDDIMSNIIQFMGPNNDFYGMVLKPCHLGEKNLNFMMEDGSEMIVEENDMIIL